MAADLLIMLALLSAILIVPASWWAWERRGKLVTTRPRTFAVVCRPEASQRLGLCFGHPRSILLGCDQSGDRYDVLILTTIPVTQEEHEWFREELPCFLREGGLIIPFQVGSRGEDLARAIPRGEQHA